jgi:hypothetical protein
MLQIARRRYDLDVRAIVARYVSDYRKRVRDREVTA